MGKNSKIEWCTHSWNPWLGCKKVSAGCKNCYMYREQSQRGVDPALVRRTKTMNDPLKWAKLGGNPRVFTCSYSDFFLEEADCWRDEAWDVIRRTPNLIYQVLTKRIERVKDCLPDDWPLRNVWLGVTAENQEMADRRIPVLLATPAILRFVSVEPMLGPVDASKYMWPVQWHWDAKYATPEDARAAGAYAELKTQGLVSADRNFVKWVIVGCESGPKARPMDLDWVRSLRDQCREASTLFFFKQAMVDGKLVKMPELDGQVWGEYPLDPRISV